MSESEREREKGTVFLCVSVCICVYLCVFVREREGDRVGTLCVCVCERERGSERESDCVYVCVRKREGWISSPSSSPIQCFAGCLCNSIGARSSNNYWGTKFISLFNASFHLKHFFLKFNLPFI